MGRGETDRMKELCGITKEIHYDEKIEKINFELVNDKGTPIIRIEDWTKEGKEKTLVTLHIKEAIELKSIIDVLVVDYLEEVNLFEKEI